MIADEDYIELRAAAASFLARIDEITSEDFTKGGERSEREYLRSVLLKLGGGPGPDPDGMPADVLLLERLHRVPAERRDEVLGLVDKLLDLVEAVEAARREGVPDVRI